MFEVRIFLLFKRTMATFYSTPYYFLCNAYCYSLSGDLGIYQIHFTVRKFIDKLTAANFYILLTGKYISVGTIQ